MNTSMKSNMIFAFFVLSILMVIAFAGVIIVKIMFWPPCTPTTNGCIVDGWSMAGFGGTVLGVAATVLALLGAFAVAAWWTGLDERVGKLVESKLAEQEAKTEKKINDMLARKQNELDQKIAIMLATKQFELEGKINNMLAIKQKELEIQNSKIFNTQKLLSEQEIKRLLAEVAPIIAPDGPFMNFD